MLTSKNNISNKPVPRSNVTFPHGIQRPTEFNRGNVISRTSSKACSESEQGETTTTLDLPLISKHDFTNIAKPNKTKTFKFLRRSASDTTKQSTEKNQRLGKTSSTVSHIPKYSFNVYDLYTNTAVPHLCKNIYDRRRTPEESKVGHHDNKNLTRKLEYHVPSFKPDQLLKKWMQESYKTRRLHLVERDIRSNESLMSGDESYAVNMRSDDHSPHHSQVLPNNTSSFLITPRRRSSVFWAPPKIDNVIENERSEKRRIRTFRWCGVVIRALVALLGRMQRLSISKTHQTAYSEFLYILAGPATYACQQGQREESQPLLFDKSWFLRTRAWSRMPSWAQSLMRLPPEERTHQDVHHLKQLLGTMRSFRENLTDEMRTKLCYVIRYTICDQGRVILRQGHIGFDFYFIFSGSVIVQSDSYDEKTGETDTLVENVLRSGDGFGEIALLGDGRRTASVICKEPTELCQIDKATFLDICPVLFQEQLQEKIDFARQFDIFQAWNNENLRQLCFLSQVLEVPHSVIIERNWASSKFAYFVMKGRASMLKEFDVTAIAEKTDQSVGVQVSVTESKTKEKHKLKQFAMVGTLHSGDCTDLSVLATIPRKNIPQITLVSEGVRLFRVAVWTFLRLSPRAEMEEYLKIYKPMTFPPDHELCARYLADLNWSEFKKNILYTQRLEKAGRVLASIPATLKGSSGWARWPGYAMVPKTDKTSRTIEAVAAANKPDGDKLRGNKLDGDKLTDIDPTGDEFIDNEPIGDEFKNNDRHVKENVATVSLNTHN